MKITSAWLGDQFDAGVLERGESCWRNGQGRAASGIAKPENPEYS